MRFNPFTPGNIVGPGMFSGRVSELRELDRNLFQAKHGNPRHFLIHGERGIGKSSLMLIAKSMARGQINGFESQCQYKFITIEIEIQPSTTYESLTSKVGADLAKELRKLEQFKAVAADFWNILKNWEVLGVKYQKQMAENDPAQLLEELCDTVAGVVTHFDNKLDGIVILIDEADKASEMADLGGWVKVFTERLTKRDCRRVCLGLCGISSVLDVLRASHESSTRVFHHMLLEPLLHDERLQVIKAGLLSAKAVNKVETQIRPDAADWIAKYSEGYPHFIQQYAHSAFESDTDDNSAWKTLNWVYSRKTAQLTSWERGISKPCTVRRSIQTNTARYSKQLPNHLRNMFQSRQFANLQGLRRLPLETPFSHLKTNKLLLPTKRNRDFTSYQTIHLQFGFAPKLTAKRIANT